jgi:hypothetical protein
VVGGWYRNPEPANFNMTDQEEFLMRMGFDSTAAVTNNSTRVTNQAYE